MTNLLDSPEFRGLVEEGERWMRLTRDWSPTERERVLFAWLPLARKKEMNDFLERRKAPR